MMATFALVLLVLGALAVGLIGLFAGPFVGGIAIPAAAIVQLNVIVAWLAGPRLMAERRPLLAPGVLAGIPFALGAYEVFGGLAAIIVSVPAAAIATIMLGMTFAGRHS